MLLLYVAAHQQAAACVVLGTVVAQARTRSPSAPSSASCAQESTTSVARRRGVVLGVVFTRAHVAAHEVVVCVVLGASTLTRSHAPARIDVAALQVSSRVIFRVLPARVHARPVAVHSVRRVGCARVHVVRHAFVIESSTSRTPSLSASPWPAG
jgi:hypothetical protein